MKLSIIVVNYNVQHFLEHCLQSVNKAMENLEQIEVFIVDNNSVDGSVEMVKEKFPKFHLIQNKENTGFSSANNQAIELASGQYILLLNPDTLIEEDTLAKIVGFMDQHPDAGGLGVKMIDGQGKFLPESKRGLPTPKVALFKMVGLSKLFPKSKFFNYYHLGFLDKDTTHKVDVLSGAFMLLRKEALAKSGLLDETFFMYGEDIDLSYRLLKSGYSNYYFAGTTIIHYKGESTKKGSLNYVILFYKAMAIFAKKHFSAKNAMLLSSLINLAIYLRAFSAILYRVILFLALPVLDMGIIYSGIMGIQLIWERYIKFPEGGEYPVEFGSIVIPTYILIWIISVFMCRGYKKPIRSLKVFQGIALGTLIILVVYALLPENLRFSRALIILGSVWGLLSMLGIRALLKFLEVNPLVGNYNKGKRIVIISSDNEYKRLSSLLKQSQINYKHMENLAPIGHLESIELRDAHTNKLNEIISIKKINEVIFSAKDTSFQNIMAYMAILDSNKVNFKIAPPESMHIIGSNSANSIGEFYIIDINSITKTENIRKKRIFDLGLSIVFCLFLPIWLVFVRNRAHFIANLCKVIIGSISWVGLTQQKIRQNELLPSTKKGVLTPADKVRVVAKTEIDLHQLDLIYAKDYQIVHDINIVWKGFAKLGRQVI